ncbi:MAG: hypothetical protein RBT55_12620 [Rhodocyclaceae bacterium]|jgi:hypothetical protein|nr:hypothetical protein [Rhodocyclaceae bacterium]
MPQRLPPRETLTVEFKSDLKKLPDRELIEALVCLKTNYTLGTMACERFINPALKVTANRSG